MIKGKFLKGLILISSVSLVTAFLLYRAGIFNKVSGQRNSDLQMSNNNVIVETNLNDTTKPITDSPHKLILPSSKSLVLTDNKTIFSDSSRRRPVKGSVPKTEREILSSSKSGIILKPSFDSIQMILDTSKIEIKKKQ